MAAKGGVKVVVTGEANLKQIQREMRVLQKMEKDALKTDKTWRGAFSRMGVSASDVAMGLGVAAAAFGAFAVSSVNAYKDSEAAALKLRNTLANMPKLAGENEESFQRLASQLQDLTAVEDDVAVEAMAMLGTFNMTGREIRAITPLVADYSRKFGVDMVEASKQVGKAIAGQIGALKRNGVTIDEAAYKADRFTAVQEALRNQVGGFAREEAKAGIAAAEQLANAWDSVQEAFGEGLTGGGFGEAGEGARDLADALRDLEPAASAAGDAIHGIVVGFNDFIQNSVEENLAILDFFGALDTTTEHLFDAWRDGSYDARMSFHDFKEEVYDGNITVKDFYIATGDAADATSDMAGATQDASSGMNDYAEETEDAEGEQKALTRAMDGTMAAMDSLAGKTRTAYEADLDRQDAVLNLKDAQQRLTEVMADNEATSDDVAKAQLNVERAELRVKDATYDAEEAARDYMTTTGAAANDPSFVKWLNDIRDAARGAGDKLNYAARQALSLKDRNDDRTYSGNYMKRGAGAKITSPEFALIGERGHTEYAITTEPLYRSRSLALYDQLGRDLGVNNSRTITIAPGAVVVNAGGVSSPYEIARIFDEQLRATVRNASLMGA